MCESFPRHGALNHTLSPGTRKTTLNPGRYKNHRAIVKRKSCLHQSLRIERRENPFKVHRHITIRVKRSQKLNFLVKKSRQKSKKSQSECSARVSKGQTYGPYEVESTIDRERGGKQLKQSTKMAAEWWIFLRARSSLFVYLPFNFLLNHFKPFINSKLLQQPSTSH